MKMQKYYKDSHILDHLSCFVTKTFLIRFCDEEKDLNDICQFRAEIDSFPFPDLENVFFQCELFHSHFSNSTSLKKLSQVFLKILY